jgi:hypothetical protein
MSANAATPPSEHVTDVAHAVRIPHGSPSDTDRGKGTCRGHRKEDPETREVFLAPHPGQVRLVEVSGSLAPSGEVLPFQRRARRFRVPR